jgi:quinolinate synthase
MNQNDVIKEILRLADERDALILAHNYQRDEIQELAHITGDSLALSMEAARTDKSVIVFCGVHFMAESAAILAPEKTVLLPRLDAGCPMADMITAEGLREFKSKYPGVPVVTYVNSSAAVKAESDICCTSSNAVNVVASLADKEVILAPDRNLGRYIADQVDKTCYFWDGYCPTHERFTVADVEAIKADFPGALFMAHPECPPEVLAQADHVCSTSGMYSFASENPAKQFIVGTEAGILYRLRKENPDLKSLQTMSPQVTVPEEVRIPAKITLDRMLAVPRD